MTSAFFDMASWTIYSIQKVVQCIDNLAVITALNQVVRAFRKKRKNVIYQPEVSPY